MTTAVTANAMPAAATWILFMTASPLVAKPLSWSRKSQAFRQLLPVPQLSFTGGGSLAPIRFDGAVTRLDQPTSRRLSSTSDVGRRGATSADGGGGRGGNGGREREAHHRAFAVIAVDPDAAAMGLDDGPRQGEAETEAALLRCREGGEEIVERFRNARSIVSDADSDLRAAGALAGYADHGRSEARRVGKECVSTGQYRWLADN